MPVTTTRTVTTTVPASTRVTHHDLSLHGRAGAILILILICLVTFIVAFSTAGWRQSTGGYYSHHGLWESCNRGGGDTATQVLMCLALVGLVVAVILIFLYLFAQTVSKYQVLLGLTIDSFITFALMLVAIIVYGVKFDSGLYWSYGVAVISTILCLCAAIISAIQLARC